jgi:membrane protein implicated in regulation of membrane protease activity
MGQTLIDEFLPTLFVLAWWGAACYLWPVLWPVWLMIAVPQTVQVYFLSS